MATATATPRPKSTATKSTPRKSTTSKTAAVNTKPAAKRAASSKSTTTKPASKTTAKTAASKSKSTPAKSTTPEMTSADIKAIAAPKAGKGQHVFAELLTRPSHRQYVQVVLDSVPGCKSHIVGTHLVVIDSEAQALWDAAWVYITSTIESMGREKGMFPTEMVRRTMVKRLAATFGLSKPKRSGSSSKSSKPSEEERVTVARRKRDQHAALRTWAENGSKGKRPETPDLDDTMAASAIAKGKAAAAK